MTQLLYFHHLTHYQIIIRFSSININPLCSINVHLKMMMLVVFKSSTVTQVQLVIYQHNNTTMSRPNKEPEQRLSALDHIFSCFRKSPSPEKSSSSQAKINSKDDNLNSSMGMHDGQIRQSRILSHRKIYPENNKYQQEKPILRQESDHELRNKSILKISNNVSKYRLLHGECYSDMLQPRDQVLEHNIDLIIPFDLEQLHQTKFIEGQIYKRIKYHLKKFIIETTSNVTSIAFSFLNQNKLDEKEAKQYASKNIMLNTHTIVRETFKALEENQHTKKILPEQLEELKFHLLVDTDEMLSHVFDNLADYYPQAPAAGGTPRMRDAINDVNRLEDQENDLIYANKLIINDHLKYAKDREEFEYLKLKEEDQYTGFIMEVINSAIRVTQSNEQDSRERTVCEIFTQFNQQLFWLTQNQHFQSIINSFDLEGKKSDDLLKDKQKKLKKDIVMFFDQILETNGEKTEKLSEMFREKDQLMRENTLELEVSHIKKKGNSSEEGKLLKIFQNSEQGIEQQKKEKKYMLGQKIPSYVKEFNKQELICQEFSSKHSSILRILTKWNEYLEDIFQNAEKHIRQRLYPFKTVKNQLVTLTLNDWGGSGRSQLIEQLNEQYKEVKNKEKIIIKSSYEWISHLLTSNQEEYNSNVCRYSSTRSIASKINAVLTSLTIEYTNTLIHHLLKAGRNMKTDKGYQNINLVVFRVNDLLRSKLQCSESSFISLLKTLYLLDNSEAMRDKFKLIRIKNKLDDPANNIIVNYLFMGKVQCELQLSIQESKGKQKNYYIFSHFIYELMRGKFGSIAECSIMISQLDPLITACKQRYYVQKKQPHRMKKIVKQGPINIKKTSDSNHLESRIEKNIENRIFQCSQCKKLIINQTLDIFENKSDQRICNGCHIDKQSPEKDFKTIIKGFNLRQHLSIQLQAKQLTRIKNYDQFSNLQHEKCIAILSDQGQLNLNVVIRIEQELKTFLLRLNTSVLADIFNQNYDFSGLDYIDISKKIRKHHKSTLLMYMIKNVETLSSDLYKTMNTDKNLLNSKLKNVIDLFREFRKEKTLIKSIKFKAEIIEANDNDEKWTILDKINRILVLKENIPEIPPLKYNKYHHLDLVNLKQLEAREVGIDELPCWLNKCLHLNSLSLERNSLKCIKEGQLPSSLTILKLSFNQLEDTHLNNLKNLEILDLRSNRIKYIDLTDLSRLTSLFLSNNTLENINLDTQMSLVVLNLDYNLIRNVKFLPNSLEQLSVDKKAIFDFNCGGLAKLKKIHIWNGWEKRDMLKNLKQGVELLINE